MGGSPDRSAFPLLGRAGPGALADDMVLSEMRSKYSEILAGLGSTSTSTINGLLNGAYQYTLPKMVPGQQREGTWTITTVASQEEYAMPSYVIAPRSGGRLSTDEVIGFWTDPSQFWARYSRATSPEGQPSAGLYYGRTVTLRAVPNGVYTIYQPVATGPATALSADTDEIADYDHAMCVVCLAALETCEENDLADLQGKIERRLNRYMVPLRRASLARARQRRPTRDF